MKSVINLQINFIIIKILDSYNIAGYLTVIIFGCKIYLKQLNLFMSMKNIIITLFLLIALNFNFQSPASSIPINPKQRISYTIESKSDKINSDFLKKKQKKNIEIYIEIKYAVVLKQQINLYYNTS